MNLLRRFGIVLCLSLSLALSATELALPDSARVYSIGEVVVTGSNSATGRDLLPYTVSVVDREQFEASGSNQLLSILSSQIPGLFVTERNIFGFGVSTGGSGGIKIRGVGGSPTNAVLMMVDGQPQFAGIYSHHVADFYETDYVDRIEVLRGPGSVLYGSNAMGGVINVVTKQAEREGVETTLRSQFGSYNTWLSSLTNTFRLGRFSSLLSLGYDRTDGVERGFDFKQLSGYAKVGYDFSEVWKMQADYSLMRFVGNDPVYPRLENPESTDIYHQHVTRGEASLSVSNRYDKTHGMARVYYSYGNHYVDDPNHFHSLDDRLGIILYQNFSPWRDAAATVGFDFDIYTGKIPISGGSAHTPGSLKTMGRKSITEYSPYLTLSQDLWNGVLILNAGLRMANSDRFSTQWIPQGGFVVHPARGWLIKASVAKGYRNPSFKELYLYRMANPDLEPESMVNYEVTVGKNFSHYLSFDVTGYYSKGSDMIQIVDMKNVNTGKFTNKGVEVSLKSQPLDNLLLTASYSFLHTSLEDLAAAPKNQYFVGVGWQAHPKFRVDAELRGVGGLFVSPDMSRQDYALLNMKLSYRVFKPLELFASLNNLTHARYTIVKGYKMPGFNGMGGVKVRF